MPKTDLAALFADVDAQIRALESGLGDGAEPPPGPVVDTAQSLTRRMIAGYLSAATDKAVPASDNLLALWKALVKGDPAWNTIRDNCRELVYYRNCLDAGRPDALPARPARMAVRTLRHLHLFIKSRCEREGRL